MSTLCICSKAQTRGTGGLTICLATCHIRPTGLMLSSHVAEVWTEVNVPFTDIRRMKVHHMYCTNLLGSQILVRFTSHPSAFESLLFHGVYVMLSDFIIFYCYSILLCYRFGKCHRVSVVRECKSNLAIAKI